MKSEGHLAGDRLRGGARTGAVLAVALSPYLFGSAEPWAYLTVCLIAGLSLAAWLASLTMGAAPRPARAVGHAGAAGAARPAAGADDAPSGRPGAARQPTGGSHTGEPGGGVHQHRRTRLRAPRPEGRPGSAGCLRRARRHHAQSLPAGRLRRRPPGAGQLPHHLGAGAARGNRARRLGLRHGALRGGAGPQRHAPALLVPHAALRRLHLRPVHEPQPLRRADEHAARRHARPAAGRRRGKRAGLLAAEAGMALQRPRRAGGPAGLRRGADGGFRLPDALTRRHQQPGGGARRRGRRAGAAPRGAGPGRDAGRGRRAGPRRGALARLAPDGGPAGHAGNYRPRPAAGHARGGHAGHAAPLRGGPADGLRLRQLPARVLHLPGPEHPGRALAARAQRVRPAPGGGRRAGCAALRGGGRCPPAARGPAPARHHRAGAADGLRAGGRRAGRRAAQPGRLRPAPAGERLPAGGRLRDGGGLRAPVPRRGRAGAARRAGPAARRAGRAGADGLADAGAGGRAARGAGLPAVLPPGPADGAPDGRRRAGGRRAQRRGRGRPGDGTCRPRPGRALDGERRLRTLVRPQESWTPSCG